MSAARGLKSLDSTMTAHLKRSFIAPKKVAWQIVHDFDSRIPWQLGEALFVEFCAACVIAETELENIESGSLAVNFTLISRDRIQAAW